MGNSGLLNFSVPKYTQRRKSLFFFCSDQSQPIRANTSWPDRASILACLPNALLDELLDLTCLRNPKFKESHKFTEIEFVN